MNTRYTHLKTVEGYSLESFQGAYLSRLVPGKLLKEEVVRKSSARVLTAGHKAPKTNTPPADIIQDGDYEQAPDYIEAMMQEYEDTGSHYIKQGSSSTQSTKRGKINGYSWRSQRRYQRKMATIENKHILAAKFGTLSYPPECIPVSERCPLPHGDWDAIEEQYQRFADKLRRIYSYERDKNGKLLKDASGKSIKRKVAILYKREYMKSGYPHLHLILLGFPGDWIVKPRRNQFGKEYGGVPDPALLKLWSDVDRCWWSTIGTLEAPKERRGRTQVRPVFGNTPAQALRKARSYLTKYQAKEEHTKLPGRWYGQSGDLAAFLATSTIDDLSRSQAVKLARWMDKARIGKARCIHNEQVRKKAVSNISRHRRAVERRYTDGLKRRSCYWMNDVESNYKKMMAMLGVKTGMSYRDALSSGSLTESAQLLQWLYDEHKRGFQQWLEMMKIQQLQC